MTAKTRTEHDSLGPVEVPHDALFGAQTQRAAENFKISDLRLQPAFITALADIKRAAVNANRELGLISVEVAEAIGDAAGEIVDGRHHEHFVVDVFQTGSGTSTNMNMNEVLSNLAARSSGHHVHPNDDVNCSQSSNDVIPSCTRVSAATLVHGSLLPALSGLNKTIVARAEELPDLIKTGRTHLMDALPLRVADELGGWSAQLVQSGENLTAATKGLFELPLGGTAIGSGVNAHPEFARLAVRILADVRGLPFVTSTNRFRDISSLDAMLDLSAQLRTLATVLMKISNDIRWMSSGPHAGLHEIELPALQPGSSIMPAKVNPVIPEAVAMVAARVFGNDTSIGIAAQSGNFQLNVMQPLVAHALLESIELLTTACEHLDRHCIAKMQYQGDSLTDKLELNPILITAIAPDIGYEVAAKIAQEAQRSGRTVLQVAIEMTDLPQEVLEQKLDPLRIALGNN